jgi:hypothetical protein
MRSELTLSGLYIVLASSSAINLGFITITPGKAISLGALAILQPSEGSITGPRVSCLASLWPISLGFNSGFAYSRLSLGYCSGWASPSLYRSVGGNSSFIGCPIGSFNALRV